MTIGHSAGFTWDGEVLIFGHEPGGGGQAQCQATSPLVNRTLFFFDADTGARWARSSIRGRRRASRTAWHNYNMVPTSKRYVIVSGNYQSGISVVDFTDPGNAFEVACRPGPAGQPGQPGRHRTRWGLVDHATGTTGGSTSPTSRGLLIWDLRQGGGRQKARPPEPQTQEFTIGQQGSAYAEPSRRATSPRLGPAGT